jgi:hypothetical protein
MVVNKVTQMKEIDKIKYDILEDFYIKKAKAGDALHMPSFMHNYVIGYNPKEKSEIENAFSQLISEGIIEDRDNGIFLTQYGEDIIYPQSQISVINKIKSDIIQLFRESNANVGYSLNDRVFLQKYVMNYNPKEKNLIEKSFEELANEKIIEIKDNGIFLTKNGVQSIY